MLTVKPPISLKCNRPMRGIHTDLNEKILATYSMMSENIRREELLYLTTATPDIYFAEGGQTSIINEVNTRKEQNIRLEVINNLINRIMISQTEGFTYRDEVYISTILRKLGITDVSYFMKQVRERLLENRSTERLIELYENNREYFEAVFKEKKATGKKEENAVLEPETAERERLFIQNSIFERLDTATIYSELKSFAESTLHYSEVINKAELAISEQISFANALTVQDIKNKVLNTKTKVNMSRTNAYELSFFEPVSAMGDKERLSAAVLLNIVDHAYELRAREYFREPHSWFNVVNAMFDTASNTYRRFESNLREARYLKAVNELRKELLQRVNNEETVNGQNIYYNPENVEDTTFVDGDIINETLENAAYGDITYLKQGDESIEKDTISISNDIRTYANDNDNSVNRQTVIENNSISFNNVTNNIMSMETDRINYITNLSEELTKEQTVLEHAIDEKKAVLEKEGGHRTLIDKALENIKLTDGKEIWEFIQRIENREGPVSVTTSNISGFVGGDTEYLVNNIGNIDINEAGSPAIRNINSILEAAGQNTYQSIVSHSGNDVKNVSVEQTDILYGILVNNLKDDTRSYSSQNTSIYAPSRFENSTALTNKFNTTELSKEFSETELVFPEEQAAADGEYKQEETTKMLIRQLRQIDEKNSLVMNRVHELESSRPVLKDIRVDKKRVMSEALRALTNPEEVMERVITSEITSEKELQYNKINEQILDIIPKETREIFEQAQILKEKGETVVDPQMVEELIHAKVLADEEQDNSFMRHGSDDLLSGQVAAKLIGKPEATEQTGSGITEHIVRNEAVERLIEESQRRVELVHREEEIIDTEELLETVRQQKNEAVTREIIENHEQKEEKIINLSNTSQLTRLTTNTTKNVEELIQKSFNRQLGRISDQVYHKLEKKLEAERRRRGY